MCVCVCVRSFSLLFFRFAALLIFLLILSFVLFAFCEFSSFPIYCLWFVVAAVALSLLQSYAFASLFGFRFFLWCAVL